MEEVEDEEEVEEEVEEMEVETKAKTPQDKRNALSSIFSTNCPFQQLNESTTIIDRYQSESMAIGQIDLILTNFGES